MDRKLHHIHKIKKRAREVALFWTGSGSVACAKEGRTHTHTHTAVGLQDDSTHVQGHHVKGREDLHTRTHTHTHTHKQSGACGRGFGSSRDQRVRGGEQS